ncbi:MAG: D-hexose-6-phosphate mutarotase, partial [Glaciecola sp.]
PNTDNILSTDIYHKDRPITAITHAGHDSLVVWNPWRNKSQSFVDFADDEYLQMICVETALTQHFELAPHNHHHLIQTIA